jgi:uncharacterized protein (DUF305 family)
MPITVEPQEYEQLIEFYRLRHHHQMAAQASAMRLIEAKDREIKDLTEKLKKSNKNISHRE